MRQQWLASSRSNQAISLRNNTILSSHHQDLYHHNSKRFDTVIDCIIFAGKQNILLGGRRDANCSSHQHEFIAIGKSMVERKIAEKVTRNELNFQLAICDECTDVIHKEQLSLSVRFVAD